MSHILVTGGAGYIGSVLCKLLLGEGHKVTVLDNLSFGGESIVDLLNNDHFSFIKGDIRSKSDVEKSLKDIDCIVHLAAIVGDPACAKEPELTKEINLVAAKQLYDLANQAGVKQFIFSSTCSNYGKMSDPNSFVNEASELSPVSLYAETKVAFEKYLLEQGKEVICKPTCLRFSTVYGLSPRLRFDLTVNEFTKELSLNRELVIFGEQFWRPYCHVVDLSRSVLCVIDAPIENVEFNVFNVGDTEENYQKEMIVNEIKKQIPNAKIKYVKKDEDPRDYRVSFEKISTELGFKITKRVPDGIAQMHKVIKEGFINDPDNAKYTNI